MKRSEMIKLIVDKLFYGSLAARVDSRIEMITMLAESDAEAILSEIEKFGMLPPESNYLSLDQMKQVYGDDFDTYLPRKANVWEPEE